MKHKYFTVRDEFEKAMAHTGIGPSSVKRVLDIVDDVVEWNRQQERELALPVSSLTGESNRDRVYREASKIYALDELEEATGTWIITRLVANLLEESSMLEVEETIAKGANEIRATQRKEDAVWLRAAISKIESFSQEALQLNDENLAHAIADVLKETVKTLEIINNQWASGDRLPKENTND